MKILARVDIGERQITKVWDLEGAHLIILRFDSEAIAIPLDKSRVRVITKPEELLEQVTKSPQQPEYIEAISDSVERVYLGVLNISNAVVFDSN